MNLRSNKEYLTNENNPEDPEWVQSYENQEQPEIKDSPDMPKHKKLMSRIKFATLKERFDERAIRSGVDPDTLNFLDANRIYAQWGVKSEAMYIREGNYIVMDYVEIENTARRIGVDPELFAVLIMIHEQLHAASKFKFKGLREAHAAGLKGDYTIEDQVGYGSSKTVQKMGQKTYESYFRMFDEGINEKLAREIILEYLESHPDFTDAEKIDQFRQVYQDEHKYKSYELQVFFINKLITKLSVETGVSENAVWEALVRGKFEGEDFSSDEVKDLFSETFSSDFLDKLSKINNVEQGRKLVELLKHTEIKKTGKLKNLVGKIRNY